MDPVGLRKENLSDWCDYTYLALPEVLLPNTLPQDFPSAGSDLERPWSQWWCRDWFQGVHGDVSRVRDFSGDASVAFFCAFSVDFLPTSPESQPSQGSGQWRWKACRKGSAGKEIAKWVRSLHLDTTLERSFRCSSMSLYNLCRILQRNLCCWLWSCVWTDHFKHLKGALWPSRPSRRSWLWQTSPPQGLGTKSPEKCLSFEEIKPLQRHSSSWTFLKSTASNCFTFNVHLSCHWRIPAKA